MFFYNMLSGLGGMQYRHIEIVLMNIKLSHFVVVLVLNYSDSDKDAVKPIRLCALELDG